MKKVFFLYFSTLLLLACGEDYAKLPQMTVDFTWPQNHSCFDERSPEISLKNVPEQVKQFQINMQDLDNHYNHGGGTVDYDGSNEIAESALKKYRGPCPPYGSPRYEFSVKALNDKDEVIAFGKKMKRFPPVN